MRKKSAALLLILPFSAVGALAFSDKKDERIAASANSAPPFWEGADSTGAILTEDCPVEVTGEKLTIEAPEIGEAEEPEERLAAFRGTVKAEYTFKNPTDAPLTVTLAFPFGCIPAYAESETFYDDVSPFSITKQNIASDAEEADVEKVDFTLRYSFNRGSVYGDFDVDDSLSKLYGERKSFYRADLPVYQYTYELNLSETQHEEIWDWTSFSVSFLCDGKTTRVFSAEGGNMGVTDGYAEYKFGFNLAEATTQTVTLYSVGGEIDPLATELFRYDKDGEKCLIEDAVVTKKDAPQTQFGAFVESLRPEESGISQADWFNAYIDLLEGSKSHDCPYLSTASASGPSAHQFMRWFEYRLEIGAGESVVNTVRAPIYPEVDFSQRDNRVLTYTYLLSPAQKWAKFGKLEIDVETPYRLFDSTLTFTEREGGYTFTRDGLPFGELVFSLSEDEPPAKHYYTPYNDYTSLIVAIVILSVIVAAGITVTVVLVVMNKRRKRRREEEERRLRLGRTEEGTVDLPPVPPKDEPPQGGIQKEDAPKADAPKADAPKADAPKADAPKADAPRVDPPHPGEE